MPQQNNMSFFLSPVDDSEVKKIIAQLKDGVPGKDGIMSQRIKMYIRSCSNTIDSSY